MPKLRRLSGADACKVLSSFGFREVRRRSSHAVMQRALEHTTITVPVPLHDELRTGTLLSIIRQSGVPRAALEGG